MEREEAIEVVKKNYPHVNESGSQFETALRTLIPELVESEDERIRKEIISFFKTLGGDDCDLEPSEKYNSWIAWLEKQGENNMGISEATKQELEDNLNKTLEKETPESCNEFLEKQGGQKPEGKTALEAIKEEKVDNQNCVKPDKVEPKFKVGDWLVHKEMVGVTCCITQIRAPHYYLTKDNSFIKFGEEDNYRPWTIQDAKDGDVLVDDRAILLFRSIGNRNWKNVISYYAILETNLNNRFSISDDEEYWGKVEDCELKPATKEQRDLLFQKMHEAGYEWDADRLKLTKCEQKPAENKGMNLVEEEMTPFQKKVFCIIDTTIEEEQGLKQVCDELLRLAHDEIMQKSWSEEYEKRIKNIEESLLAYKIIVMDNDMELANYIEKDIEWLKSLKYRYTWKPSEEQIDCFSKHIEYERRGNSSHALNVLSELLEQLKKLKD